MSSGEQQVVEEEAIVENESKLESKEEEKTELEEESAAQLDKSKSAEEIASMISQQQQISLSKSNENLIVSSFVSFFDPLIQNLDTHVQALRSANKKILNQPSFQTLLKLNFLIV